MADDALDADSMGPASSTFPLQPVTAMHLIQLLLPLYDNDKKAMPRELFDRVREELVERFGGLTAYVRAPVSGLWQEQDGQTAHDDLVIYEVMAEQLDEDWWRRYREDLETRFAQEALVVRAQQMKLL
jgi:hypothetical protein